MRRIGAYGVVLAMTLVGATGCGGGADRPTSVEGSKSLQSWMKVVRAEIQADEIVTPWQVSLDGSSGAYGTTCKGDQKERRAVYLATFDRLAATDDDSPVTMLSGVLSGQGWDVDVDAPTDPDDQGLARIWSAQRAGKNPTGTRLDITVQAIAKRDGRSVYHYVVLARTDCLAVRK